MQTDPVGYDDQFNLYAYVANDPVNNVDPSGRDSMCVSLGTCFGDPNEPETAARQQQAGDGMVGAIEGSLAFGIGGKIFSKVAPNLSRASTGYIARSAQSASYYLGRAAASLGRTYATPALRAARDAGVQILKQNRGVNEALGKVWGSGLKDAQAALQQTKIVAPEGLTKEIAGAYRSSLEYNSAKALDAGNKLMYDVANTRLDILKRMGF